MKKMKLGVALLAMVLLLGISVSTAGADEVSGTTEVQEEIQMQASEGASAQVSDLTFGNDQHVVENSTVNTDSGIGWNYDSSTNTLNITETMTVEANISKIIQSNI